MTGRFMAERFSVKAIREDFKSKGVFYTPAELVKFMRSFFPDVVNEIYDPTCGHGALLAAFDGARKYGQDINQDAIDYCHANLEGFEGCCADTLAQPCFMDRRFDWIVANPPFSIRWRSPKDKDADPRFVAAPAVPTDSRADYAFILHCLHLLSDNGTAAILSFPGILYRGQREGMIRQWLVDQNYVDTVVAVDGGKFEDTAIATCVLVLKKNRSATRITFKDGNVEQSASLDEVRANGYILTPNAYLPKEEVERPQIDPMALEHAAQDDVCARLDAQIRFTSAVDRLENAGGALVLRLISRIDKVLLPYRINSKGCQATLSDPVANHEGVAA